MNENKKITENKPDVPYIVFEGEMARSERHIKRLWITILMLIGLLAVTNIAWVIYESQFETISYEQDGEGLNNINTGSQGDVYGTESAYPKETKWQGESSKAAQSDSP